MKNSYSSTEGYHVLLKGQFEYLNQEMIIPLLPIHIHHRNMTVKGKSNYL